MEYIADSCLWEITLACNLHCAHCGSSAGAKRENELSRIECFDLGEQIIGIGCTEITLIGGEITLLPYWKDIARLFADNGLNVNIMSNGYGYTKRTIEEIAFAGLSNVGISIDGLEETHNAIRNKIDSFREALSALRLMVENGIETAVVTCVFPQTISQLEEMYRLFVCIGVKAWQLQLPNSMGRLQGKINEIDPENVSSIIRFIETKAYEQKMIVYAADSIGYFLENENVIRGRRSPLGFWNGCKAGINSFFIDSVGNVKGCGSLYSECFIEGNIRKESLRSIWQDEGRFSYNRNFTTSLLTGACADCESGILCKGGCRSSNYFNNGGTLYENKYCARLCRRSLAES